MEYTPAQISLAVENLVGSFDSETLLSFCIEQQLEYYLGKNVSGEEIEFLINETGLTK